MWSSFSRRIWGNQESDAYERGDAVLAWWDPELQFEFVMIFDTHHKTKNIDYIIEAISERKEIKRVIFLSNTFSFSSYTYVLISVIYR